MERSLGGRASLTFTWESTRIPLKLHGYLCEIGNHLGFRSQYDVLSGLVEGHLKVLYTHYSSCHRDMMISYLQIKWLICSLKTNLENLDEHAALLSSITLYRADLSLNVKGSAILQVKIITNRKQFSMQSTWAPTNQVTPRGFYLLSQDWVDSHDRLILVFNVSFPDKTRLLETI